MGKIIVLKSGIVAPAEGKKRRAIPQRVSVYHPEVETGDKTYIERMAEQRAEWKKQDEAKFYNPDNDPDAEGIWNVYVWMTHDPKLRAESWRYVGQRNKKTRRRKPMTLNRLFAGIRQSLGIPASQPVKLISEQDDRARKLRGEAWEHDAPKHHDTLAPWKPPKHALKLRDLPAPTETKVRKDTAPKLQLEKKTDKIGRVTFSFKTRYLGWGKRQGGEWYYLGPAMAEKKVSAKAEVRQRFPLYPDPVIVPVKDLSYSLRARLRDGRVVPGSSKIPPPKSKS